MDKAETANKPEPGQTVIYTVGHSNRPLDDLIALLKAHGIEALADVRSMPGSRRLPHFNAQKLEESLPAHGIEYHPLKLLGGRRRAAPDSINTAWRSSAFRGFADYMATANFAEGLDELAALAARRRTAIMCAEAVPWRCHRNLIADALVMLRRAEVLHIMREKRADPHRPHDFARVERGVVVYDAEEGGLFR